MIIITDTLCKQKPAGVKAQSKENEAENLSSLLRLNRLLRAKGRHV